MGRRKAKTNGGRFSWKPENHPEDQAIKELSEFLVHLRMKHGLSVLTTTALLDLVRQHLNDFLLENGLED